MLACLKKRATSDRGDSELVSLIILLPLVVAILITLVDVSIYFSNRAVIQGAVRDSARTVAIMGGNGDSKLATPIEKKYGEKRGAACKGLEGDDVTKKAYNPGSSTAIECHALQAYAENAGLVNVEVTSLKCDPPKTEKIGEKTQCIVEWNYGHVPGSGLNLFRNDKGKIIGSENTTVGKSESEVNMSHIDLVDR